MSGCGSQRGFRGWGGRVPCRGDPAARLSMRLILVGGGLANGLIAHRLEQMRPEVDWTILEAASELGGNHTWSFHASDLNAVQSRWIAPFLEAAWPDYDVVFPALDRHLRLGYRSASSALLRAVLGRTSGARCRTGAKVVEIRPTGVTLEGGEILQADAVIDGRGDRTSPHLKVAYQKFLGIEYRTSGPHGLVRPILMDATVPQRDGYRFVYTLPLGPDRLLIEDTYYSDNADLDAAAMRRLIDLYAAARGWSVTETLREERGGRRGLLRNPGPRTAEHGAPAVASCAPSARPSWRPASSSAAWRRSAAWPWSPVSWPSSNSACSRKARRSSRATCSTSWRKVPSRPISCQAGDAGPAQRLAAERRTRRSAASRPC